LIDCRFKREFCAEFSDTITYSSAEHNITNSYQCERLREFSMSHQTMTAERYYQYQKNYFAVREWRKFHSFTPENDTPRTDGMLIVVACLRAATMLQNLK